MTEWQDISTAPRDGRAAILLTDGRSVSVGAFAPEFHGDEWPWVFLDYFEQREDDGEAASTNAFRFDAVTHWMPLPPSPCNWRVTNDQQPI